MMEGLFVFFAGVAGVGLALCFIEGVVQLIAMVLDQRTRKPRRRAMRDWRDLR